MVKENPKVSLDFYSVEANAYAILGRFDREARRSGWSEEDIKKVITEAKRGDYDHLIQTIMRYCE